MLPHATLDSFSKLARMPRCLKAMHKEKERMPSWSLQSFTLFNQPFHKFGLIHSTVALHEGQGYWNGTKLAESHANHHHSEVTTSASRSRVHPYLFLELPFFFCCHGTECFPWLLSGNGWCSQLVQLVFLELLKTQKFNSRLCVVLFKN